MSTTQSRQQVLELISTQRVTAEEGQALLAALEPRDERWTQWLFDPLRVMSTRMALSVGAAGAVLSLVLSRFAIRFDGALDVHRVAAPVAASVALIDLCVAWLLPALVCFALARRGRPVDFIAAVGLSRLPSVMLGSLLIFMPAGDLTSSVPWLIAGAILGLGGLSWVIALFVLGLRTASGLKGSRWVATAVGAIVLSELLSQAVLYALHP